MNWLRGLVYGLGFRPKAGSILYSPSRAWLLAAQGAVSAFRKAVALRQLGALQWNALYGGPPKYPFCTERLHICSFSGKTYSPWLDGPVYATFDRKSCPRCGRERYGS